jgi:hypothetical protein
MRRIAIHLGALLILFTTFCSDASPAEGTRASSSAECRDRATNANAASENITSAEDAEMTSSSSDMLCGRHSLFILLRLLGYDIPYSTIERKTPVGLKGSNLLELQEAARQLGIGLSIYKCDPSHVEVVRDTPSIVLIRARYRIADGKKIMLEGHYVVTEPMPAVSESHRVNIIDSAFNCHESLSDEDFSSVWTGYYLASSPWYVTSGGQRTAFAGVIGLLGLAAWRFWRVRPDQFTRPPIARRASELAEV